MLSTEQINDLHRLYWSERWPVRKIERHLCMSWHTIRKYLDAPARSRDSVVEAGAPGNRACHAAPRSTTEGVETGCQEKEERLIYRISIITECPQGVALIASSSP